VVAEDFALEVDGYSSCSVAKSQTTLKASSFSILQKQGKTSQMTFVAFKRSFSSKKKKPSTRIVQRRERC